MSSWARGSFKWLVSRAKRVVFRSALLPARAYCAYADHRSGCGGRCEEEWKSLWNWRCCREFQIWHVQAFWFPPCQEMREVTDRKNMQTPAGLWRIHTYAFYLAYSATFKVQPLLNKHRLHFHFRDSVPFLVCFLVCNKYSVDFSTEVLLYREVLMSSHHRFFLTDEKG